MDDSPSTSQRKHLVPKHTLATKIINKHTYAYSTYIINGLINHSQISWGAIFEVIAAFAVIGTSVTLYPILKKSNERMALEEKKVRQIVAIMFTDIVGYAALFAVSTNSRSRIAHQ